MIRRKSNHNRHPHQRYQDLKKQSIPELIYSECEGEPEGGIFRMKANSNDIANYSEEKAQEENMVFDKNEALEIIEDDEEFLKELAEIFINDAPEQMSEIKEAVYSRNSKDLTSSAHKLKGAVACFGEKAAFKATWKLEIMGRENRLDDVEETYEVLVREAERLVNALREFVRN
ncbi:MAG: Hpt domain-containing protein [Candidatus Scalindua sediminis]|nr:Hpt domain-containing protein [Candidatus Scalindua sediminis]